MKSTLPAFLLCFIPWLRRCVGSRLGVVVGLGLAGLLAGGPTAQAQNLITNPGFESGNSGFVSQYRFVGTANNGPGSYTVRADESTYNGGFNKYNDHTSGDGTGLYLIGDGSGTAGQYVWQQTITGLLPNTQYTFAFWQLNSNAGSLPSLQVSSSPTAAGPFINAGTPFINPNTTGAWQQNSVVITTTINTSLTIQIVDTNLVGGSNDFGIDDVSLLAPGNTAPVANAATNSPIVNTSGPVVLSPNLSATASGTGNSIRSYTVAPATAGTLFYNGTAVTANSNLTLLAANIGLLTYQPAAGATTPATFSYTATDANGNGSAPAVYTIPVIASAADVVTTLAVAPTALLAGNSLTFTTTVKNNGPTTATGVVPTVQLQAALLLPPSALPAGATYNNTTGLVTLPTTASLPNGSTVTFAITFNAPNYTGTLAGTAASTASSTDPTAANNNGSQAGAKASTVVTLPVNGCAGAPYGATASSGLYGEYFAGYFADNLTYFAGKTPGVVRTDGVVNFPATNSWGNIVPPATGTADNPDAFSARYRGSINIAKAGSYTFYLTSDDASDMWLDGAALSSPLGTPTINNGGAHGATLVQTTLTLSAGVHNVLIFYGEQAGDNNLVFEYSSTDAGIARQVVPNSVLCASMSQVPVANNVTNSPAMLSNSGPTALVPLSATDPDGQIDTYTILTLPAAAAGVLSYNNGTTTTAVTANQVIRTASGLVFNPAVGFSGNASFTYAATDNSGEVSNTATFTIPVTLAVADVTTTLTGPVQLGQGQPGGPYKAVFTNNGPARATQVTQVITLPVGATLTADQVTASGGTYSAGNGTLTFGAAPVTLASGASNTYSFTLTAPTTLGNYSMTSTVGTDTNQGSNTAPDASTLAITVTPANRFVTFSDNNSLAANTKILASVILNDSNPDATTAFTATLVTNPAHGAVTLNANGNYTYTPNPNYIGSDSFTYQICQVGTTPTCSNISPVSLSIYDPNLVCTSGTGPNLLQNPSFTAGNTGFTSSYGYVAQSANALVPEGLYGVGSDASQYHPNFKGTGRTGAGDNFMIVNGAANLQKVYSQTVTVLPNRYYTFSVYANSVNPASPAQLGFVINNESTSVVTTLDGTTNYVKLSDVWYSGNSTSAVFEIRDVNRAAGGNDFGLDDVYFGTCTKTLIVNNVTSPALPKNAPATAIPALSGTSSGGPTLASFTIQSLPDPASGVLALSGVAVKVGDVIPVANAGNLTFNPTAAFTGSQAVFTYTGTDSNGAGSDNTATYTIPLGTPIVAVDDVVTTPLNTAVTFDVTANDRLSANGKAIDKTTVDLRPGIVGLQQGTSANPLLVNGGTVYANSSGQVIFTPTTGFLGTVFIPYTVMDVAGIVSNQATFVVNVRSQLDLATSITAPATGATVLAGQPVTVSGTTANNSPAGTLADAVQQLQLPANLIGTPTFTRNGASVAATYDRTTGLVTFPTLTRMSAGSTSTFSATFLAPGTGPLAVTAAVNNSSPDVNLVDNVAAITLLVTPQFDLATTLSGPTSVVAGNLATYTITSANNGPSPVIGAAQTVQLPIGLNGVFATNGGTYDAGSGLVTFPLLNLASAQVQTNSVSFAATAAFAPSASVTPNTTGAGDPITTNNVAYLNGAGNSTSVAVTGATSTQSNLYVTATGPSQVAPGAAATYTVTQGNNGPGTATGVQTQVSLPMGLGTTGFTVGNVAGTLSNGQITFGASGPVYVVSTGILTLPVLTSQGSAATPQSYTIVLPAPGAGPALTVTASVSAATSDPVPGNNVATVQTEIQPTTDLAISLSRLEGGTTTTGSSLTAGQQVTYSVQTVNRATAPAQNVVQTVAITGGLPVASLQLNGVIGTLNAGVISFASGATYNVSSGLLTLPTLATLAGGAVQTNTISFAAPTSSVPLQAVAAVSTTTTDNALSNNSAVISNTMVALQDLAVALSGPAQALQGNTVFYTATVVNNGASAAGQQTTTVQLPTGLGVAGSLVNNVAGTLSGTTITFGTNGPTYDTVSGLLTLPAVTVGPVGTSVVTTLQFVAPVTAQIDIAAAVTAGNESNLANNSAVLSTLTQKATLAAANLATTITPTTATLAAGALGTYTVTTTAAAAAQNVIQTVALPASLDPTTLRINNTAGSYNPATGIVSYAAGTGTITYNTVTGTVVFPTLTTLAANGNTTNTIAFPMPVTGPVVLTATASADNPDGNTADNAAVSTTTITTPTVVAVGISGPATTTAGTTVSYPLTATNNGPAPAADFTVTFTLPAGVTSYSVNGGAAVNNPGGAITVFGGSGTTVPAGQSVTNVISFTAPSGTFTVSGAVSTTTTGTSNATTSTTTAPANAVPVANDVVNSVAQTPLGNTANTALPLTTLSGTDAGGTISSYMITSIPNATTQGVLKLGGNAVTAGQVIAPADIAKLTFTPVSTFVGNSFFTYTVADNNGAVSAPARYAIPVAQDLSSVYTRPTNTKGGVANRYKVGDVLAYAIDPNAAQYNTAGLIYDPATGAAPATGTGPISNGISIARISAADSTKLAGFGVGFARATGLFTVVNPALFPRAGGSIPAVTVTSRDLNGGVNTNSVALTTSPNPLPVELTLFTAQALKNVDAALSWRTASEKDNDHFDVERSLNGTDFVKIGQVKGQGNSVVPTDYTLTDAGIGRRVSGIVYYRLTQVDADGTSTHSPVRSVTFTPVLTPAISLFPNPATTTTSLDLTQLPTGSYSVSVLDAAGRTVLSATLAAGQAHPLDLNTIASGTYLVLVRGQNNGQLITLTKRLIKE